MFDRRCFGASVVALALVMTGCSAGDSAPSKFTFSLEGEQKDFSKSISVSKNFLTDAIEIAATSTEGDTLTISLKKLGTGTFTQADYDAEASIVAAQYELSYRDSKENSYSFYPGDSAISFRIAVDSFENRPEGEVSGSFNGVLGASLLNGEGTPKTLTISEGVFSYALESEVE